MVSSSKFQSLILEINAACQIRIRLSRDTASYGRRKEIISSKFVFLVLSHYQKITLASNTEQLRLTREKIHGWKHLRRILQTNK